MLQNTALSTVTLTISGSFIKAFKTLQITPKPLWGNLFPGGLYLQPSLALSESVETFLIPTQQSL